MRKIFLLIVLVVNLFGNTIDIAKDLFDNKEKYKEAIEIFEKYKDDGESQYYLGKAYLYGMGVEKNEKKAFELAKKSADKDNPSGLNLLGVIYDNGHSIEKDQKKAFGYYTQAANLGNTKAMRNLALMYQFGNSLEKNFNQAETWFLQAIKNGNQDALSNLAELYWYDVEDNEKALEYFFKYEEYKKLQPYQYDIVGRIYEKKENYVASYDYFKKAVDLKYYKSTFKLFDLVSQDELKNKKNEALEYLQIAVNNNDSMATSTLIDYLINKTNETKKAFSILRKSYYEFNNIRSGCSLASYLSYNNLMEGNDFSITYNPEEALDIINKITKEYPFHEEISMCYTTLARLYVDGNYVEKNYQKAIEIYMKIKQKYSAPYLQEFTNEMINDLEKAEKFAENNLNNTNISDENNLFNIIDNFSKVEQVLTVLSSQNYYFISTSNKNIIVIDKKTLQTIKELRGYISNGVDGVVTSMAYDEKNKLLYCAGINSTKNYMLNDIIKVYDINTGKILKTIQNKKSLRNTFLNISEDGKFLVAINNNKNINFINIETNEIQNFDLNSINDFIFASIEKTSNDYLIHLVSKEYIFYTISHIHNKIISKEPFINQIDIQSRTHISKVEGKKGLENIESFIPIKNLINTDNNLKVELENNKYFDFSFNNLKLKNLSTKMIENGEITISYIDDNSTLEIFRKNKKIGLINLGTQKILYHKIIDNKYIFVVNTDFTTQCFFDLNGNPLLILDGLLSNQKDVVNTQNYLISYGDDNIIHVWDKKIIENSKYNQGVYDQNVINTMFYIIGINPFDLIKDDFSEEELITINKSIRANYKLDSEKLRSYFKFLMIKKENLKPLASLYIKNENDWIMYTPEGLFTYGGNGKNLLKYHQNQGLYKEAKIIENDKLFDKFYRPDLIKKILAGEKVEIPMDVKSVILNILPPELKILENKMLNIKDIELTYQVCDTGNGMADLKLLINGQAINPPQSRGISLEKVDNQNDKCKIYKSVHTLYPGTSTIELKAYDKEKYIANVSDKLEVNANYKIVEKSSNISKKDMNKDENYELVDKANLYLLSLAVDDYENKNLNLKYPVKDVNTIKEEIKSKSKSTFENIYTFDLYNEKVTKENINQMFDEISKKIKYNDTFILYIAGHGIAKDGKYQLVSYKINEKISIDDLKQNLSKIVTNKSLVLLDTCQSGAAIDDIVDKTATVNRLSHDDNRNYIVASSKDQVALEGYNEHGVFTYSVLDAFKNNENLKVWGLADHVSEVVPRITQEKFHFEQRPEAKLNHDFVLSGDN